MAKSVKLGDIAAIVGVSTVTVSKALSDQKGVSEELRAQIKQLADEMGYQSPSEIRKKTAKKKYNIGVLIQEIYLDKYPSFYWQLYQVLNKKAVSRGCFTMLEFVTRDSVMKAEMPMILEDDKVDGIVVVGSMGRDYLEKLEKTSKVPIEYMDYYDNSRSVDTVISNSFYGSYMLTNYLYDMGHRDIAYVGTVGTTNSITDRYLGYMKSLIEHGIPVREDWIIPDRDAVTGKFDMENGFQIPKEMPTAFVCNCDLVAATLIKLLTANGYRVPEDASVVGFDNYLYPGTCDIEVTTYDVNIQEMAERTLHKMIKKISNEKYTDGIFIVDGHLVIKDSVARR